MEIIPAISILKGHCVALYKGSYEQKSTYFKTPLEMLHHYERAGAKKIQITDLDGCESCKFEQRDLMQKLAASSSVPLQLESGFKTLEEIATAFTFGYQKIVLRFCAYPIIKEALAQFGPEKIIISIQGKRGELIETVSASQTVDAADNSAGLPRSSAQLSSQTLVEAKDVVDFAEELIPLGVKEVIYKDQFSEGTLIHPNYDEVDRLFLITGQSLKIYAAGGISEIKHLLLLKKIGASGAIIGKAFSEKMLSLKEAERAVGLGGRQ